MPRRWDPGKSELLKKKGPIKNPLNGRDEGIDSERGE
jgi:hypothetical protein